MQMEEMKNLIASSDIEKELLKNLNTIFADSDYEILRIRINENKKKNIQIMIDHKRKNIDINDCAKYSRKISNYLENNHIYHEEIYQLCWGIFSLFNHGSTIFRWNN